MDKKIVLLSGMPASGKDTVTQTLCATDPSFILFKKHKSVGLNDKIKETYVNIPVEEFEQKIRNGEFIQYHQRYGRFYGIAVDSLLSYLQRNLIPIIHIGRIENYYAFCDNFHLLVQRYKFQADIYHILLWETWEVLHSRIILRDKTEEEIQKRLQAAKQEFEDNIQMMNKCQRPFTLVIKNTDLHKTCNKILDIVIGGNNSMDDGYNEFWKYLRSLGVCDE